VKRPRLLCCSASLLLPRRLQLPHRDLPSGAVKIESSIGNVTINQGLTEYIDILIIEGYSFIRQDRAYVACMLRYSSRLEKSNTRKIPVRASLLVSYLISWQILFVHGRSEPLYDDIRHRRRASLALSVAVLRVVKCAKSSTLILHTHIPKD
jgi:hypothetical protein